MPRLRGNELVRRCSKARSRSFIGSLAPRGVTPLFCLPDSTLAVNRGLCCNPRFAGTHSVVAGRSHQKALVCTIRFPTALCCLSLSKLRQYAFFECESFGIGRSVRLERNRSSTNVKRYSNASRSLVGNQCKLNQKFRGWFDALTPKGWSLSSRTPYGPGN